MLMKVTHCKLFRDLLKIESLKFLVFHKFMKRKASWRCISMLLKKFISNYSSMFWKTVLLKITKLPTKRPWQRRRLVTFQDSKWQRRKWIFMKVIAIEWLLFCKITSNEYVTDIIISFACIDIHFTLFPLCTYRNFSSLVYN